MRCAALLILLADPVATRVVAQAPSMEGILTMRPAARAGCDDPSAGLGFVLDDEAHVIAYVSRCSRDRR